MFCSARAMTCISVEVIKGAYVLQGNQCTEYSPSVEMVNIHIIETDHLHNQVLVYQVDQV